jgi:hypothetical protein
MDRRKPMRKVKFRNIPQSIRDKYIVERNRLAKEVYPGNPGSGQGFDLINHTYTDIDGRVYDLRTSPRLDAKGKRIE